MSKKLTAKEAREKLFPPDRQVSWEELVPDDSLTTDLPLGLVDGRSVATQYPQGRRVLRKALPE